MPIKKAPIKRPRFAQLTLDFIFKKVFASESRQSEDFLISLIESFLGEYLQGKIKKIQLLPNEQRSKSRKQRAAVFDLHCTDNNGNRFIIEMQLAKRDFFMGRILFYLSLTIAGIVKKGKDYKFDLPRIYSLSFLNFEPDLLAGSKDIVNHIGLTNLKHPEKRHSDVHIALVVLTRFKKTLEQCKTTFDVWLYLFKNLHKLDEVPERFRRDKFRGVFEIAEISNFNERELREYEAEMKYLDDYNATIAYADKSGFGRGVTQERKNVLKLIDQGYSLAQIKRMLSKKAAVGLKQVAALH
ncbi:MAG: Rpn family recombination-promoting nuclease/putative transposase [Fibromonadales bacterium]|nr:Rpn family recombination-promoting nuclease/putative transposase [Fibromonadales bacterium]